MPTPMSPTDNIPTLGAEASPGAIVYQILDNECMLKE